jgi:hypothetical protein
MKKALIFGTVFLAVSSVTPSYTNLVSPVAAASTTNAEVSYLDIKGHWAQKEIEYLASKGVIGGYADGTFKPGATVTRAQFSKILAGVMEVQSDKLAFSNMNGHWSAPYVNGLVAEGIIVPSEFSNGYNPNLEITRLEMAKMIARGLAKESLLWKEALIGIQELEFINLPFNDQSSLNVSDMPYIALANGSGIVNGTEKGSFDANGKATRAQATVMLKRYLDTKDKAPALDQLLTKFKGEKSIHAYSKTEMEKWIDREADIARLYNKPIQNKMWNNSLKELNGFMLKSQGEAYFNKYFIQPAAGYMDVFFNRNYKTIGEQFKKDLRYYIKSSQTHKGVEYTAMKTLPKYFDVVVQDTKNEKQISESIFVTNETLYYQLDDSIRTHDRVRGTQYIRYTSGTNLPKGVQLNKWYKRDIEVQLKNFAINGSSTIKWATTMWAFDGHYPITSFVELKK